MSDDSKPTHKDETILELEDLRVWFPVHGGILSRHVGDVKAVDGISLKVRAASTRAAGYQDFMRCPEIVNTLFIKGHIADPFQAGHYRLLSGLLRFLQRDNACSHRVRRLATLNRHDGPVARVKILLRSLNIAWDGNLGFTLGGEQVTLGSEARGAIRIVHATYYFAHPAVAETFEKPKI